MTVPVVLVVDDEPAVRELLRRWIEGWSYNVRQASSASEALDIMKAVPVSILVCDIKMAGHDGLWLAERVRSEWPHTAIVMASGVGDVEVVRKARHLGAVAYVPKPFGRELLWQALTKAETLTQAP
jgi:two-component system response regulator (stage 0 sporulation protein F)